MKLYLLWLIGFILLIVESTLTHWFMPISWQSEYLFMSSHFSLIYVIYIALFAHRYQAFIFGLTYGMIHDIMYYGQMIGIYMFGMAITGYFVGVFRKSQPDFFYMHILMMSTALLFFECINYLFNRLFQIIDIPFIFAIQHYILPSIIFNLLFAGAFFKLMRRWIESFSQFTSPLKD